MPMTTTHALVPLAATLAFAKRPVPWRLVAVAALAAAAPDIDGAIKYFLNLPVTSIYAHRGAAHSFFIALVAGLLAAVLCRPLRVRPLTAGTVVTASMASHGILDMMTNSGLSVAYLWPLSSVRLFADWRPIKSAPVHLAHLISDALVRLRMDLVQLIIPMFALAVLVRLFRIALEKRISRRREFHTLPAE